MITSITGLNINRGLRNDKVMYYGKSTAELDALRMQYEQIFGEDPNGEMELEFGEKDYGLYCDMLKKCIETKKDIFEVLDC